jgi:hypothetical protein
MAWGDHYRYDKYLFIHAAETVFAARVNQASFTYPLAQVTFDTVTTGAWTDIGYGMTILFGSTAGASDLGRQRVRAIGDSSTLLIGWSSRGTHDGEVNLADDAYITVLDDHRAWSRIPRITSNGTLYKDYDIAAATGANAPPVANGGVGILDFVDDSTSVITKDFDGSNSLATAPGATISSYAWDFVDGTPASAATATVSGVTFPQGFRWVTLTVTDSNTKTHTCYIPVAAIGDVEAETSYSGAIFTASSQASPTNSPDKAFDGNSSTFWVTAVPNNTGFIKIQYPSAQTITKYIIKKSCVFPAYLTDWTMEGSNNDTDWTIVDTQTGQTLTADQTYTIASAQSFIYYRLNITGSNSGTQVGLCEWNLFAINTNYFKKFEVSAQTLTRNGQNFSVVIREDVPAGTYYDGALVMYGEDEYYNDVKGSLTGPDGRKNVKFIGWHDTDPASLTASENTYITTTEFNCVDIGGRMRQLPAFPQAVLRDASPSSWLQLKAANTDRYIHYLLHWHSTVLDLCDLTLSGTGDTYGLPRFQSPGQNLFEQVQFRAASIAHELTISMRGELGVTVDPMLQDSGDRTSTVITDIDPDDWMNINYTVQRPPRVYQLWGNAVVASTQEADASDLKIDAVFSVAPGKAPGQGETEQTQGEQLAEDQTELNARTGHQLARLNAPYSLFDIPIVHPGDAGIDPSLMQWVRLTITTALAAQRGLSFTDDRFLPVEVDITHNNTTQTKEYFLRAERETVGTPGATVVVETGDVLPDTPDIDEWPWIWEDETGPGLFRGTGTIAAFDTSGLLHITNDFATPEASGGPTWTTTDLTGLTPALGGTPLSVVGDPFSPKYLGTGTTVNGWILTTTGIYSIADIFGVSTGPTLALQHTLATANPDNGFIAAGVGVQDWVLASAYYSTAGLGTKAVRTTNGGTTWAESTITTHYWTGVEIGGRQPPLHVSSKQAGLAYAGAYSSSAVINAPGDLYKSTDYGATWALASTPATNWNGTNGGTLQFPWHDNTGELLMYSTYSEPGVENRFYRTESDGTTLTNITPATNAAPRKWWACSVCPIDRQRVAVAAEILLTQGAIYVSKDAGDTWTQATSTVAAADRYEGIGIAGNDPDVIYAWGQKLQIAYSQDFGQTWEDKTTKLAGSAEVIVIIGG